MIQAIINYVIIAAVVIMIIVVIIKRIKKGAKGLGNANVIVLNPTELAIVKHIVENPTREDAIVAGVRSEKERLKKNA